MKTSGLNFETTYTALPEQFFTMLEPEPARDPAIVILNNELASEMELDFSKLTAKEQANLFSAKQLPNGSTPFSQAYAGHQFGHFAILGDGRAHLLGEHVTSTGKRFDLQYKGSGRTPYSRSGDGKAALGPMLREYIISEAMHHLNIPTTRGLAVVTTGEPIFREALLPGAILTRVASSHIRVGTFQLAAYHGNTDALEALMSYTIKRHYPELVQSENKALDLIRSVQDKQIDLIVNWMRVGFIHGVMNTDNMTLAGETIDYGPCAFMDQYDPKTVFSSIDYAGRYAYSNQPLIGQWNLARFAEALLPLIDDDINKAVEKAGEAITEFSDLYKMRWLDMMRTKLGLFGEQAEDEKLIDDLLDWMQTSRADFTNTFRDLTHDNITSGDVYKTDGFKNWHMRWQARIDLNSAPIEKSRNLMKKNNPAVIPRNHKVEEALEAANSGNLEPVRDLHAALGTPYKDRAELAPYQNPSDADGPAYQTFCGT